VKSAIVSSADSSSPSGEDDPERRLGVDDRRQVVADSIWPNRSGASAQKRSTRPGSNWEPRRSRATATAASTPPARWKASTTSASVTNRAGMRISSPLASAGTPLPSQRSNVW
jgi:hypothetical protein